MLAACRQLPASTDNHSLFYLKADDSTNPHGANDHLEELHGKENSTNLDREGAASFDASDNFKGDSGATVISFCCPFCLFESAGTCRHPEGPALNDEITEGACDNAFSLHTEALVTVLEYLEAKGVRLE